MQPKACETEETNTIFFISPRKIVIKTIVQGIGYLYADSFQVESKLVVCQPDPNVNKVSIKGEFRVNWLKTVRFIASTLLKESER